MGIRHLWSVLSPYAERKPMSELRGKTVAIDLAGWVCASLNVVDYFVHPKNYLRNIYFRTCCLIWEEVTPVFILEGEAPKLKRKVIARRNEIQFRGTRPEKKRHERLEDLPVASNQYNRTHFNEVLKQCETLLVAMGITCLQAPGEAEAYCAFLNKKGIVDGVISQDSDCFAYGAINVYRNFSASTQGSVDVYDMRVICEKKDFGQNKTIVMALLCGCDYCPDGIRGVGRESVLKLFANYTDKDILRRIRSWRKENDKYAILEMKLIDKTICSNCGHLGHKRNHAKNGCRTCRRTLGCDESFWKEERLCLKTELLLRRKAIADSRFPSEEIIEEFFREPTAVPHLDLSWKQPNIVIFIKEIGHVLQWSEIYCFQKFLPLITRWQIRSIASLRNGGSVLAYIAPKKIIKKQIVEGVPSLQLIWEDKLDFLKGLIPDTQINDFISNNAQKLQELWATIEPLNLLETAYPNLVKSYLHSIQPPQKRAKSIINIRTHMQCSLDNINDLIVGSNEFTSKKKIESQYVKLAPKKDMHLFWKFLDKNTNSIRLANGSRQFISQCPTSVSNYIPSHYECERDDIFDMSDIVNDIVRLSDKPLITSHGGYVLHYEGTPPRNRNIQFIAQCSTPMSKCIPSDFESDCDDIFDMSDIVKDIVRPAVKPPVSSHGGYILRYESLSNLSSEIRNLSVKSMKANNNNL